MAPMITQQDAAQKRLDALFQKYSDIPKEIMQLLIDKKAEAREVIYRVEDGPKTYSRLLVKNNEGKYFDYRMPESKDRWVSADRWKKMLGSHIVSDLTGEKRKEENAGETAFMKVVVDNNKGGKPPSFVNVRFWEQDGPMAAKVPYYGKPPEQKTKEPAASQNAPLAAYDPLQEKRALLKSNKRTQEQNGKLCEFAHQLEGKGNLNAGEKQFMNDYVSFLKSRTKNGDIANKWAIGADEERILNNNGFRSYLQRHLVDENGAPDAAKFHEAVLEYPIGGCENGRGEFIAKMEAFLDSASKTKIGGKNLLAIIKEKSEKILGGNASWLLVAGYAAIESGGVIDAGSTVRMKIKTADELGNAKNESVLKPWWKQSYGLLQVQPVTAGFTHAEIREESARVIEAARIEYGSDAYFDVDKILAPQKDPNYFMGLYKDEKSRKVIDALYSPKKNLLLKKLCDPSFNCQKGIEYMSTLIKTYQPAFSAVAYNRGRNGLEAMIANKFPMSQKLRPSPEDATNYPAKVEAARFFLVSMGNGLDGLAEGQVTFRQFKQTRGYNEKIGRIGNSLGESKDYAPKVDQEGISAP